MRFLLTIIIVAISFLSCSKDAKKPIDVSAIKLDFKVDRFDVDFYKNLDENILNLKEKYPLLFPMNTADSVWISKRNNKDEQELFTETQKIFKDFSSTKNNLLSLFKYVKYYNPKFKSPNVITMLTNIDYDNRVIYPSDSLLIISLDAYLGKEHIFYSDYPKYIKENNTKERIVVDVANAIINKQLVSNTDRSFLGKILFEGKKLFLLDLYLPLLSAKEKTGYTIEKLEWAINNEEQIWKYFIERKLLYSTDTNLNKRFIENAPFSKFYLEQDNLSPGRIGSWIGWNIVASYMKHNDVSLQELMNLDAENILNKSKYKPKK